MILPLYERHSADEAELLLQWLATSTGLPWFAWSSVRRQWLGSSGSDLPAWRVPPGYRERGSSVAEPIVGLVTYELPDLLPDVVFCGYVRSRETLPEQALASCPSADLHLPFDIDAWQRIPLCDVAIVRQIVHSALQQRLMKQQAAATQQRLTQVLAHSTKWERERSLLCDLSDRLTSTVTLDELAPDCLERLQLFLPAEACFLWVPTRGRPPLIYRSGTLIVPEARLISFIESRCAQGAFVSRTPPTAWGIEQDVVSHFAAVPFVQNPATNDRGWLVVCNYHPPLLSTAHAELLKLVATMLSLPWQRHSVGDSSQEVAVQIVRHLVGTLDAKDPHTRGHSERVALLSRELGEDLGLEGNELEDLYLSGLLHDIGKVGVSDHILQKTGPLLPEEFAEIRRHPVIGYQLLEPIPRLRNILPGVRSHHEAYNGKGYPDRLCGEAIPLQARIIAVADSFDAMTSDRPYRAGLPRDRVEEIFRRGMGEQWDAKIVQAYFRRRP